MSWIGLMSCSSSGALSTLGVYKQLRISNWKNYQCGMQICHSIWRQKNLNCRRPASLQLSRRQFHAMLDRTSGLCHRRNTLHSQLFWSSKYKICVVVQSALKFFWIVTMLDNRWLCSIERLAFTIGIYRAFSAPLVFNFKISKYVW